MMSYPFNRTRWISEWRCTKSRLNDISEQTLLSSHSNAGRHIKALSPSDLCERDVNLFTQASTTFMSFGLLPGRLSFCTCIHAIPGRRRAAWGHPKSRYLCKHRARGRVCDCCADRPRWRAGQTVHSGRVRNMIRQALPSKSKHETEPMSWTL